MMWLLSWLAALAAAGAAAGALGYVAVCRFGLLQRLLATLTDRALARVADSDGEAYAVTHTDTGVVATNVSIRAALLRSAEFGGSVATQAGVARLEVCFPSFSRPLTLRLDGVSMAVQQARLPLPRSAEERAAAEAERRAADVAARLAVVEQLLWGSPHLRQARGGQPSGGLLGRLQAKAAQRLLAVAVQYVRVEVSDVCLRYVQYGEPGPRPSGCYLQGADGACLRLRQLTLLPQGAAAPSGAAPHAAEAEAEPSGASASSQLGSLRDAGAASAAPAGSAAAAAAASAASAEAAVEAAAEGQLSWTQSLLAVPALLWSSVATDRPSSTRLAVSGVSLSLLTYPSTWQGYHAAKAAADAAAAAAAPAPPPFAFTPGRGSGTAAAPGSAHYASPNKRRRPRVTAQPVGTAAGSFAEAAGTAAAAGAAGGRASQDVQQQQQQQAGASIERDCWALLAAVPAEEHVLLRQWEFAVTLSLLPPGFAPAPQAAPSGGGGGSGGGTPRASSVHRSESLSPAPSARHSPHPGLHPPEQPAPAASPPAAGAGGAAAAAAAAAAAPAEDGADAFIPELSGALSLGVDALYDTDYDYESPHVHSPVQPPAAARSSDGPAGAAPVSPPQPPRPHGPPRLDRSSMMHEAPTLVTAADRLAANRGMAAMPVRSSPATSLLGVAALADGGLPTLAEEAPPAMNGAAAGPARASASQQQEPAAQAGGSSSAAAGGSGSAAGGGRMVLLDVQVSLKALVPEVSAASLAILSRLADRQMHHQHFGAHWAARPQVPVLHHASAWWRHAGEALAGECGRAARREVPLDGLEARRQRRLEYQALYAASHTASPGFQEPGRRWWQRRRVQPAAADDLARLAALEAALTAEEVAHFRFGVAALHNARLAGCPPLLQFVADKLDCIVYNREQPSPALLAQLLHADQPWAAAVPAAAPAAGEATSDAAAAAAPARFGIRVHAACPKLGVAFSMQRPAAAAPAGPHPGGPRPDYVQLTFQTIAFEMSPTGGLLVEVERLVCGPCASPVAPVPPHTKILSAPSAVCRHVCKAADFFQYATHGTVAEEALTPAQLPTAFLTYRETPRPGVGGLTVDCPPDAAAAWVPSDWRPGGSDRSIQLAAVALVYHTATFAALLEFIDGCDACKAAPWAWRVPAAPGGGSGAGSAARSGPPPLPADPEPVGEMVLSSFSAHGAPTLGTLSLEGSTLRLHCPGLALQLPYEHLTHVTLAPLRAEGGPEEGAPPLRYALTVTVQNMLLSVAGEDASGCLQGGVARRVDATAYVDVFSYLSSESRHTVAARLVPARITFDAGGRPEEGSAESTAGLEAVLREIEIASMAKVWAHPDDLGPIIRGIRSQEAHHGARMSLATRLRAPSMSRAHSSRPSAAAGAGASAGASGAATPGQPSGLSGGGGLGGGMPAEFIHDPSKYPMPHIPFLKCGSIRAHTLQPLSAAPGEPGGKELAVAVSSLGLQTWVSPVHIWHLLSVEKAVRRMLEYLERSSAIPIGGAAAPAPAAPPPEPPLPPAQQFVRPRSPKLLVSVGVAQVSLLWLIGTWTPKGPGVKGTLPGVSYRRAWGISVKRDDDAYLWARWLAPVYSVTVANVKAALRLQASGCVSAGASVDGVVVRDLQLPEAARHAYVLRPLPARARRLNAWHASLRRVLLGIEPVSHGRKLWTRACQTIFLRNRTSAIKSHLVGDPSPLDAVAFGAPYGLGGPQARLSFTSTPASRYRPAAAEINAEVGQLLAYVRIKQQASMTAFATQLGQITQALGGPGEKGGGEAAPPPPAEAPCSPTVHLPKLQTSLKVVVSVVGIDVLFRVQSRDLMSLKLEQGRVVVDQRLVTRASGPRDVRLHLAASVQDVVLRDLRARTEHSLVLIPHGGEDSCTLEAALTSYVDPRRCGPRLYVMVKNPRFLLLLRFINDVMGAVGIISSASSKTDEAAAATSAAAAAAGAPAAGAVAGAGVAASQPGAAAAAAVGAAAGEAAAPAAAAAAAGKAGGSADLAPLPPLEVMVQLTNVGIVLPTSSSSTGALAASVDELRLALPGGVMPDSVLDDCQLPRVVEMMREVVQCTHEFKYCGFNARQTNAQPPAATAGAAPREGTAAAAPPAAAERSAAGGGGGPSVTQRLKQGVGAVAAAAAAEERGRPRKAGAVAGQRVGASALRVRPQDRPTGVLYLDEQVVARQPAGVLHIDPHGVAAAGGRRRPAVLPDGAAVGTSFGDVMEGVGRGIKGWFEGDEPVEGEIFTLGAEAPPAQPAQPAAGGRRSTAQGAGGRGAGPRSPTMPVPLEGASETHLIPLDLEPGDEMMAGEERPLADPSVLLTIDNWRVRRGKLVPVPSFYCQADKGGAKGAPRCDTQLPPSLSSFTWPAEIWDVVEGAPFWQPTSLAMGMFSLPNDRGGATPLLHFSATPLLWVLNAPNYTALMDFVGGNLDEFLHPEKHTAALAAAQGLDLPPAAGAGGKAQAGAAPAPAPPGVPPQTQFNPTMKFGPAPGERPHFRLTIATPRLGVTFEAHPREWTEAAPQHTYVGPGEAPWLRPFLRAQISNLMFDLGACSSGNTFMKVASTSLDLQDLRPAYRLQDNLRRKAEEAGASGYATPLSHVSEESGRSTPAMERAGSAVAAPVPPGVAAAAAAGSREAADALAPPEVRQRVLSDAAAELLTDQLDVRQRDALLAGGSGAAVEAERSAGAAEAETTASGDDQMLQLYRAAHRATQQLQHQGSDVTLSQPTPREPADGSPGSLASTLGTPGTPSTGGFSFMLPASSQQQQQRMAMQATPGLLSSGLGPDGGAPDATPAFAGLPPFTEGHARGAHPDHTGIRLSVARRLSEHAERRRSMHTPSTGGASGGPGSAARTPFGSAAGTPGPGAGAAAGTQPQAHHRVVELLPADSLPDVAGLEKEGDAAVFRVLSAPCGMPPDEQPAARPRGLPGSNPRLRLEVSLAMHADSTMAVEVALSEALLNWPYFKDLSLVWSITNIFSAPNSPARPRGERDDLVHAPRSAPPPVLATGPSAWLYFNLLITQSQIFVPVYDVMDALAEARKLGAPVEGTAAGLGVGAGSLGVEEPPSGFHSVADMALGLELGPLIDLLDAEAQGLAPPAEEQLALEDRGLALSATALRFAYAYGGDGESNIKVDLRDTAVFVRDPGVRVNCAMLPFSIKLDLDQRVPRAAEQGEVERLHRAATLVQQCWRRYCARKALERQGDAPSGAAAVGALATVAGLGRRAPRRLDSMLAAVETVEAGDPYSKPWQLVDELVMDVASDQTRKVLRNYKRQSQDRSQLMYLQRFRATSTTLLRVEAGALTLRGAFSHIPFWQTASEAVQRVVLAPAPGAAPGSTVASPMSRGAPTPSPGLARGTSNASAAAGAPPPTPFRPSSLQVSLAVQQATLVLCNDKPETFGAPDVLQASLSDASLAYDQATLLPDRPANKAGRLGLKCYGSFLNSSTSRWEALFDAWPLQAEFVDVVSPIYLSDRQINCWLTSEQHLDLNFNPASLLSVGDALAFMSAAQEGPRDLRLLRDSQALSGSDGGLTRQASMASTALPAALSGPTGSTSAAAVAAASSSAASSSGVISRAPQKYLIQNQSGLKVNYWADGGREGAPRSPMYQLDNGGSESLRVLPATKRLNFVSVRSAAVGSERLGATIHLHFEGNWMPVLDVAVNVVGKYRYRMTSPADSTWVPLIIDIILVGRTKIITLHSGIWVENAIDRDISLRLHVPTTSLVPPNAGSAARGTGGALSDGDIAIGPLKPQSGCYLPVTAVLGGRLFLRPDGFQEASRDVVRLSPDITYVLSQQGYVSCEPDLLGLEEQPLHVALQAIPAKLVSEFQAFKHMECLAPGTIQKASSPLEVTLSVQPTLVVQNALPFEMRVLLWQHLPATAGGGGPGEGGTPLPTSTGGEPSGLGPRLSPGPSTRSSRPNPLPTPSLARGDGPSGSINFLDLISPRGGGTGGPGGPRRGQAGRFFSHTIAPGKTESLYVDMRQRVDMHVAVEEIGMRSTRWSTVSHGVRYTTLPDGSMGLEATPKLAREVQLRLLGTGMGLPTGDPEPTSVDRYLAKLKDAALHSRALHAQFAADTKAAVSKRDIEDAVGRVRALARRFGKKKGGGQDAAKASSCRVSRRSSTHSSLGVELGPTGSMRVVPAAPSQVPAAPAADSAQRGQAGAMQMRHRSAGHIVVEQAPRPQVTVQRPTPAGSAVAPGAKQGPAAPATVGEQQVQQQEAQQAAALASPGSDQGLSVVHEGSVEGSAAATPSQLSPLGIGGWGSLGGSPTPGWTGVGAASPVTATAPSPSQASEAHLLTEVPLSEGGAAEAANGAAQPAPAAAQPGGVAGGRVDKRTAGPGRFSRALGCLGRRDRGTAAGAAGGGPPPAPSAGTARLDAAAVAGGSTAGGSTNASPSLDSRTSSRVLLSDRAKRSDLLGSLGSEAGEPAPAAAAAAPAPAAPSATPAQRASTGDAGEVAVLEALPEASSPTAAQQQRQQAEQQLPVSQPALSPGGANGLGQAAPTSQDPAAAAAVSQAMALAAAPASSASPRWWLPLRRLSVGEPAPAAAGQGGTRTAAGGPEQVESPDRLLARAAFAAWREHCAEQAWRRHGRPPREGFEGSPASPSPRSVQDDGEDEDVQVRAPPVLHLGLHNSLADSDAPTGGSCQVTLFAPYWLNNRTGVDLFYRDYASAPGQPLLLGAPLPWDFGEVFTPGTSMAETEAGSLDGSASASGASPGPDLDLGQAREFVLDYKLVLMNKQEEVQVGLAHVPHRRYSSRIRITTVGNKPSLELRGPVEAPPQPELHAADVPLIVAKGLRGAVHAAARGAAGAAAVGAMGVDMLRAETPDSLRQDVQEEHDPPLGPITSRLQLPCGSGEAADATQQAQPEAGGAAAGPSPKKAVGHSPFDAPADTPTARGSPRSGRHTISGPAGGSGHHGPSPLGPTPLGSSGNTPTAASAAFRDRARHLRRASMQEGALVETMASEPGTMLVRVTSTTPTARTLHRMGSSLSSGHRAANFCVPEPEPVPDSQVEEAVANMLAVPLPPEPAAATPPDAEAAPPPPPEAAEAGEAAAAALWGEAAQQGEASLPAEEGAELQSTAQALAGVAPQPEAGPSSTAAGAAGEASTPLDGAPSAGTVLRQQLSLAAARMSLMPPPEDEEEALGPKTSRRRNSTSPGKAPAAGGGGAQRPEASAPADAAKAAEGPSRPKAAVERRSGRGSKKPGDGAQPQKAYEFAVDVAAGPPDSMFRHTKVLTLKPKYLIENQTGMPMAMKQHDTADPDLDAPDPGRFARMLAPGARAAVYWDDADKARELVVRPVPAGEEGDWHWSGSFPIQETEWYFGLRIRHTRKHGLCLNIPVNVTVGSYGAIQVTLKSPGSVSPYRIENACKDVCLATIQTSLLRLESGKRGWHCDILKPGTSMPYAWDEPTRRNLVRVQADLVGQPARPAPREEEREARQEEDRQRVKDYALDRLGDQAMLIVPTHGGRTQRRLYRSLSQGLPDDLTQKLASLLAAEFSKKVYATVYADGPTRVLRFSDDKNVSSLEAQDVVLDLAARLKQVETQLRQVNAQFARLNGMSGAHMLDLYGRTAVQAPAAPPPQPALARKASKRLPLSETTRALIRQAHSRLTQVGSLPGSQAASQPGSPQRLPERSGASGSQGPSRSPSLSLAQPGISRTSTVRFDVPPGGTATHGSLPVPDQQAAGSARGGSASAAAGVLHIPAERDADREERLLPYRRLVIRTGQEAPGSQLEAGAPDPLVVAATAVPQASPAAAPRSSSEIQPVEPSGPSGDAAVAGRLPQGPMRASASGRDWGHITPSTNQAVGTRRLAPSASKAGTARGASSLGAASTMRRRQDMLRGINTGDAVLLLGGDLSVTVVQAQGLAGQPKSTHPFARVRIVEPFPTSGDEPRAKQTTVVWSTCDPVWDEPLVFRDVCAAAELVVEMWDLGGTRSTTQLERLASNPGEVIKSCRFLGRAEVALADTLTMLSGVPAGTPLWLPLARRDAGDAVSGQLQLRFVWEVTARSLLTIKLHALERVLAQRQEILAALQPVPPAVVRAWAPPDSGAVQAEAAERTARGGVMGAGVNLFGVDNELGMSGAGWTVKPSKVATEVLARHAHDHNRRHLVATVLEARGLTPRRGVVVALSASELPNPVVQLELKGYPSYTTPVVEHTLQPRWDPAQRHSWERVDPGESALTVRVSDARSGFLREARLLGEATIHCSHVKGSNPTYVWVPLHKPPRRRGSVAVGEHELSDLQVHLRLQWQSEAVRGQSSKVEVDLAGVSLVVMGGLQDELFNLTTDEIRATAVRSRLELQVEGSVRKVQLDNQMLDAVQPVVLAPAVEYRPSGAVSSSSKEPPLVSFSFVRSYAGSSGGRAAAQGQDGGPADGQGGDSDREDGQGSAAGSPSEAGGRGGGQAGGEGGQLDRQSIKSFKEIRLDIGALDLMTDEAFLEALLAFMTSIPTADVWQEPAWRKQQRRLLAAQFGPREVESLAVNAIVPVLGEEGGPDEAQPLEWVFEKETRNLDILHGQSDLSSWYFIESAEIGPVTLNVTVSLSSKLLSMGQSPSQQPQRTHTSGTFNRALGASGFSLVNVANVPISLGRWLVGNDPASSAAASGRGGLVSNGFLSQKALASNLARHYQQQGLKEAHKVLGGAGPAVASVPLTVLWAGGSAYALLASITKGNTGPVVAAQQLCYVPLMTLSMIVSGFSRMAAAALATLPPYRANGDEDAVARLIRRPNSALEAAARAPMELIYGFTGAGGGLLLDPIAGWQAGGHVGLAVGVLKALTGLVVRPTVGVLEFQSKALASLALTALGREGILGKMQRRVKAPGTYAEEGEGADALEEAGQRREAALHARALMAAWQRVLPEFFPQMADDVVQDVVNIRSTRVVLVTDRHIAYLRARHLQRHSIYRAKWLVPIAEIQNLSGDSESLKISITHVHRYDLWVMGVWPVGKRKGMRCGSRAIYERMVARLSRLLQRGRGEGPGDEAAVDPGLRRFAGADLAGLTILSAPYAPPPPPGAHLLALPASLPPTPHAAAH